MGTVGLQILKTPLVPGPGISIDINNLGMTPNSGFVTVITPFQGNFPNGWFFGLDPSLQDVGDALLVPQPAVFSFRNGTLDASGNSFYSLPLPGVPGLGVTIYGVTVEHTGWIPTGSSEPISANL